MFNRVVNELLDTGEHLKVAERTRVLSTLGELPGELIEPRREDPFDPVLHEAVDTLETADPIRDGRIAEVIGPGYSRAGETHRKARVVIYLCDEPYLEEPPLPDGGEIKASFVTEGDV